MHRCNARWFRRYLSRLCQGSKGPCVWFQGAWLTPNEFQYISGRETAKVCRYKMSYLTNNTRYYVQDWKRSIRHAGKSMKLLLTKGILSTHPPICDCEGCRMSSPVVSLHNLQSPSLSVSVSAPKFPHLRQLTRHGVMASWHWGRVTTWPTLSPAILKSD